MFRLVPAISDAVYRIPPLRTDGEFKKIRFTTSLHLFYACCVIKLHCIFPAITIWHDRSKDNVCRAACFPELGEISIGNASLNQPNRLDCGIENPLQPLRPGHRRMTPNWRLLVMAICDFGLATLAPLRR
jgi:hypothetical protein